MDDQSARVILVTLTSYHVKAILTGTTRISVSIREHSLGTQCICSIHYTFEYLLHFWSLWCLDSSPLVSCAVFSSHHFKPCDCFCVFLFSPSNHTEINHLSLGPTSIRQDSGFIFTLGCTKMPSSYHLSSFHYVLVFPQPLPPHSVYLSFICCCPPTV